MRALVYAPEAPAGLRLSTAPEPVPHDSQVLIEVHAVSLNFAPGLWRGCLIKKTVSLFQLQGRVGDRLV